MFVKTWLHRFGKISRVVLFNLLLVVLLLSALPAHTALAAGNGTTTGSITLVPTIENIGVTVSYSNDDNQNSTLVVQYRETGSSTWKTAPPFWRDTRSTVTTGSHSQSNPYRYTFRGSIFWLDANTQYEVRATFTDSDGVTGTNPVQATVTTWNDNPPSSGSSYYVSPSGSDSADGET